MKAISILKTIFSLIFYFMVLACITTLFQLTMLFIENEPLEYSLLIKENYYIALDSLTLSTKIYLSTLSLILIVLTYCIYLLIKIFKEFTKYKFFSEIVTKNLKKIGYLFIITSIIQKTILHLLLIAYPKIKNTNILFDFSYLVDNRFDNIITGLIFIGFGYVLKIAKDYKEQNLKLQNENTELKQENELTI